MASATRIYVVVEESEGKSEPVTKPRLVRASSQAQAVGHVVRSRYSAKVAKQDDLETLLGEGVKVETASAE